MNGLLMALLVAAGPISVDFRGTLGEALSQIATKGEINLIATGDLGEEAEVHLKNVTAEEALEALVKVHGLELHREGKLLIVKRASASGQAASAVPPLPPLPPLPPIPSADPAKLETAAEEAQRRADEAEARADALRDEAERIREARENADDARDAEIEARIDEAKAAVEKARASTGKKHDKHTVSTGSITIPDGQHVEDVVSYGGSVTLGNGVLAEGDVVAFGGDVVLGDGVLVDGDAVAFGGAVKKGQGAKVTGEEVSFGAGMKPIAKALPAVKAHEKKVEHEGGGVAAFLVFFATFFGLGFLLMMFAPNRMRNIEAEIKAQPVKSGLAGLLAAMGWFPLTVLLAITLVGIPIAFLMWLLGPLTLAMGMLALANTIGAKMPLARVRKTQAAVLAVGILTMMLAFIIPGLGVVVFFVAGCVAFGAIIRTRAGQRGSSLPVPEGPFREVGA